MDWAAAGPRPELEFRQAAPPSARSRGVRWILLPRRLNHFQFCPAGSGQEKPILPAPPILRRHSGKMPTGADYFALKRIQKIAPEPPQEEVAADAAPSDIDVPDVFSLLP